MENIYKTEAISAEARHNDEPLIEYQSENILFSWVNVRYNAVR